MRRICVAMAVALALFVPAALGGGRVRRTAKEGPKPAQQEKWWRGDALIPNERPIGSGVTANGLWGAYYQAKEVDVWKWNGDKVEKMLTAAVPDLDVKHASVSPEGLCLATKYQKALGSRLVLVSLPTMEVIKEWNGPEDWSYTATGFSSNGRFAAVAIYHFRTARVGVIDVEKRELRWVGELTAKGATSEKVVISNDGKLVLLPNWDNKGLMLDAETGEVLWREQSGHPTPMDLAEISDDGRTVYCAYESEGGAYAVDARTGKLLASWYLTKSGKPWGKGSVQAIAVSPDNSMFAAAGGRNEIGVYLFDVKNPSNWRVLPTEGAIDVLSFSPDSTHIAVASQMSLSVWDLKTAVAVTPPVVPPDNEYVGRVTSGGKPVPEARVRYFTQAGPGEGWQAQGETTTGADGKFRFAKAAAEDGAAGYGSSLFIAECRGLSAGWMTPKIGDGEIVIAVTKPATLSGAVVDEGGRPVAGAKMVALLMYDGLEGMNDVEVAAGKKGLEELTATTGPDGRFAFVNLPTTATADFVITAPGMAATWTGHLRSEKVTLRLRYRAGQTGIRITLQKEAVISGTTVDKATGQPVGGVALAAEEASLQSMPLEPSRAVSGANGAFEIHALPAGSYRIVAAPGEDGMLSAIAEKTGATVRAGQRLEGVKVATSKGGIIDFVITDAATGERLGNVLVDMYGPDDEYAYAYVRKDGSGAERVAPGRYKISGISKQGWLGNLSKTIEVNEGGTVKVEATMARVK